jgi:hypothetical protein
VFLELMTRIRRFPDNSVFFGALFEVPEDFNGSIE